MELRPVRLADAEKLFLWRKHDEQNPWYKGENLTWDEHLVWLGQRLQNPAVAMLIAEEDGITVGSVRIDSNGELCVTVIPQRRNQGIATKLVLVVLATAKTRLKANIDALNAPARAVAEKTGFVNRADVKFFLWTP